MKKEPVAIAGIARIIALLLARFGLDLTVDQIVVVMGVLEAIISAITRAKVTPMATLPAGVADKIATAKAAG